MGQRGNAEQEMPRGNILFQNIMEMLLAFPVNHVPAAGIRGRSGSELGEASW